MTLQAIFLNDAGSSSEYHDSDGDVAWLKACSAAPVTCEMIATLPRQPFHVTDLVCTSSSN
jgi:hypothetical protein